jgi:hypothetical protein
LIAFWAYRRRPSANVTEIPIRRSKLGSRLGFRIFGDGASRSASRASSKRRGSDDEVVKEKSIEAGSGRGSGGAGGWLDKGSISRPKKAFLENGLLAVPKPGYLADERRERERATDTVAPWGFGKEDISAPRPGRPRSAEPLGRLSGMGLGMGYLK